MFKKYLLETNNSRKTLKICFQELIDLGFKYKDIINKGYYEVLKENAPVFKKVIEILKIQDLISNEFIYFIEGKYDFIYNLKPYNKTLKWTINKVEEVLVFINYNKLFFKSLECSSNREVSKMKYILNNYENIIDLKKLYCKIYGKTNENILNKIIYNFTLEHLRSIIESYKYYLMNLEDTKFLMDIAVLIPLTSEICENKIKIETPVVKKANEVKKEYTRRKSYYTIYDYFNREGMSLEEKKEIVDKLIKDLPEYQQKLLEDFIGNNLNNQDNIAKARNVIYKLKKHFAKTFENSKTKKKKYTELNEFFQKEYQVDNMQEIINLLFYNLPVDQQECINDYLKGKSKVDSFEYRRSCNLINKLRIHYRSYVNNLVNHYDKLNNEELLKELLDKLNLKTMNFIDINYKKIPFYIAKLKLIEIKFRENHFGKKEYEEFLTNTISEIVDNYNNIEELIDEYIILSTNYLNEKKEELLCL